jgi:hypothetical protein
MNEIYECMGTIARWINRTPHFLSIHDCERGSIVSSYIKRQNYESIPLAFVEAVDESMKHIVGIDRWIHPRRRPRIYFK